MHHQRCEIDRRSVRVRLTEQGRAVRDVVVRLFEGHATGLQAKGVIDMNIWMKLRRPCVAWNAIGPIRSAISTS
jgi:DNA-binding MarR family transcriptional regulator